MLNAESIDNFNKDKINQIYFLIEENKWNEVKTIWVLEFLKQEPNNFVKLFSTFDQSYNVFGSFLSAQQLYTTELVCDNEDCKFSLGIRESAFYIFTRDDSNLLIHDFFVVNCKKCHTKMSCNYSGSFNVTPAFLYCDTMYRVDTLPINCKELP